MLIRIELRDMDDSNYSDALLLDIPDWFNWSDDQINKRLLRAKRKYQAKREKNIAEYVLDVFAENGIRCGTIKTYSIEY